jgi:hypothetical protein
MKFSMEMLFRVLSWWLMADTCNQPLTSSHQPLFVKEKKNGF